MYARHFQGQVFRIVGINTVISNYTYEQFYGACNKRVTIQIQVRFYFSIDYEYIYVRVSLWQGKEEHFRFTRVRHFLNTLLILGNILFHYARFQSNILILYNLIIHRSFYFNGPCDIKRINVVRRYSICTLDRLPVTSYGK